MQSRFPNRAVPLACSRADAALLGDNAARNRALAKEILRDPSRIQIGRRSAPAVGITQAAYPVAEHLKTPLLRHLLRNTEMSSVLVFTRTRRSAHRLARIIAADGFAVAELHSDRSQAQRNLAMEGFRRGDFQVLVATNIAARGLDVDHITHVISVDVPSVPDDYVHRIGRTARAEAEGDAFVLVAPAEEESLASIERQIGQRLPRVTLPDFDYSPAAQKGYGRAVRGSRAQHTAKSATRGHRAPHSKQSEHPRPERTASEATSSRKKRSRRRR